MSEEFDKEIKAQWIAAIKQVFGETPPRSAQWTDRREMMKVLTPFMGKDLNHAMLTATGGLDMMAIAPSPEDECLEFSPGTRMVNTFRPEMLYFEYFPESPWNSFFLLETKSLHPSGVYEELRGDVDDVVELSPGEYIDISHHETGVLDYDEDGNEIPLPGSARIVTRHLQGKFLVVAKRSIWNLDTSTYDGRHNRMTVQEIRAAVQMGMKRGRSPF